MLKDWSKGTAWKKINAVFMNFHVKHHGLLASLAPWHASLLWGQVQTHYANF